MILEENNIFKTSRNKLLNFLLKVFGDTSHVTHDVSLREEKCLEIIEDILLKMNETLYFNENPPDDSIVEDWDCCKMKIYNVSSILRENVDDLGNVADDLDMSKFLIDCNMEEDKYEL